MKTLNKRGRLMKFNILNSSVIELNTDSICIPYYKNNKKNSDLNSVNNLNNILLLGEMISGNSKTLNTTTIVPCPLELISYYFALFS